MPVPGVTSETEVVVEIGEATAGGDGGQLILEDVEFEAERDNDVKHGIGNHNPQGIALGNIEYTTSHTAVMNDTAAELVADLDPSTPNEASMDLDGGLEDGGDGSEYVSTEIYWNNIRTEATDDGDVMVELDFDVLVPTGALEMDE